MDRIENRVIEVSLFSQKEKPFICLQINFHRRLFFARAKPSFTFANRYVLRRTEFYDFANQHRLFLFALTA